MSLDLDMLNLRRLEVIHGQLAVILEPRQEVFISESCKHKDGSQTCVHEGLNWEDCVMRVKQRTKEGIIHELNK